MAQKAEQIIGRILARHHMSLGTVESATGGLIAVRITDIAGSSEYFKGSIVAYSNLVKIGIVGVEEESIARFGAVSPEVACQMACGGLKVLDVDFCIADTGIAGPSGGSIEKPVGLVYVGLADKEGIETRKFVFEGNRLENRQSFADEALKWLAEHLTRYDRRHR